MRSKTRDCKDKTDADASIENTGWTTKYHTGHPFWVSALPDHIAQQPQTQSKTETKPTSSLGSLSLPSATRMAIAHQFLQWGLHLGWAQLVFNSFPGEHGVYTELLVQIPLTSASWPLIRFSQIAVPTGTLPVFTELEWRRTLQLSEQWFYSLRDQKSWFTRASASTWAQ